MSTHAFSLQNILGSQYEKYYRQYRTKERANEGSKMFKDESTFNLFKFIHLKQKFNIIRA